MTDLISPANFDFFARYLLAGLIIIAVRSWFVVGERPKLAEALVEAVILSLINQLTFQLIAWLAGLAIRPAFLPQGQAAFFAEVLVLPSLLGFAFGWLQARGWNAPLLRRLSMPIRGPAQRAHDFAFAIQTQEVFVILTYTDGTQVYGFFGRASLAARDANRSDIYVERLYDIGDDGRWMAKQPPRGALLSLDSIRSIEFIGVENDA